MVKLTRECNDGSEKKTLLTIEMWQFVLFCLALIAGLIGWQRAIDLDQTTRIEKCVTTEQYRVDQARIEQRLDKILQAVQNLGKSTDIVRGY